MHVSKIVCTSIETTMMQCHVFSSFNSGKIELWCGPKEPEVLKGLDEK